MLVKSYYFMRDNNIDQRAMHPLIECAGKNSLERIKVTKMIENALHSNLTQHLVVEKNAMLIVFTSKLYFITGCLRLSLLGCGFFFHNTKTSV